MKKGILGWVLKATAVVLLFFGIAYARAIHGSQETFFAAQEAISRSRMPDAVYYLKTCVSWQAPFNPYVDKAYDRLWQIARKAELGNDRGLALESYRAIRSSILASRSFSTPHPAALKDANERISILMAQGPHPKALLDKSKDELRRMHYSALQGDTQPDPAWSLVLIAGLLVWVGSVMYFIFSGLDAALKIRRTPLVRSAAFFVLGMAMWVGGMLMA
ncbi:MAG: hypothetical protein ABIJ56_02340 [Pseudomonadota bacterium]